MIQNTVDKDCSDGLLVRFIKGIFYPVACIAMRYGLNEPQAAEILRWCFVRAALNEKEFAVRDRKIHRQTVSHAAVQTGLTRTETLRYSQLRAPDVARIGRGTNRLQRILAAWRSDPLFCDSSGKPQDLPMRGKGASFQSLAMKWGRDAPPRCIADALVAVGHAEWIDGKRKALRFVALQDAGVHGAESSIDDLKVLSTIATDFVASLQTALGGNERLRPRFRLTAFEDVSAVRAVSLRDQLHERLAVFNKECEDLVRAHRVCDATEPVVKVGVGCYTVFDNPRE